MLNKQNPPNSALLLRPRYILDDEPVQLDIPPWLNIVAVIAIVGTLITAAFIYFHTIPATLLSMNAVIAMLAWLLTTYNRPVKRRIIPLYILLIIANLIHSSELHIGGYAQQLVTLFPARFGESTVFTDYWFILTFVLFPTALYLWGAAGLFFHNRLANYMAWWLVSWSIVFPISHYILSLVALDGNGSLPGLYSAPLATLLGIAGVRALVRFQLEQGTNQ